VLGELENSLAERTLRTNKFLPPRILPTSALTLDAEGYKKHIASRAALVESLEMIVKEGFERLHELIPTAPDPAEKLAIEKGYEDVDELSDSPPAAKELMAKLHAVIAAASQALVPGFAGAAAGAPPPAQSYEQVTAEIHILSGLSWLIYGLLATALGSYIMIVLNLGFGTPVDYFLCLFWGFGLPAGGNQLVQSTTSSASSVLGFSIPKGAQ
jgi:hypothetical protein